MTGGVRRRETKPTDREAFLDSVAKEVIQPLCVPGKEIHLPGQHYRAKVTRETGTYLACDALLRDRASGRPLVRIHLFRDDHERVKDWERLVRGGALVHPTPPAPLHVRNGVDDPDRTYFGWEWPVSGEFLPHLPQAQACAEWLVEHGLLEEIGVIRATHRVRTPGDDSSEQRALVALAADLGEQEEARRRGRGFASSPERRRAIELRAMDLVEARYEAQGWSVKNTSAEHPYDFLATKGGARRFIEVKGTTTAGEQVLLTRNELRHAEAHPAESVLAIVHGVEVVDTAAGPVARAGTLRLLDPWDAREGTRVALAYRYVPKEGGAQETRQKPNTGRQAPSTET